MENIGNVEILQIIDAVSREKSIPKSSLIEALEQAYESAGKKKYGLEHNIKAELDKNTGEINLYRILEITEDVENTFTQISLDHAQEKKKDAESEKKYLISFLLLILVESPRR